MISRASKGTRLLAHSARRPLHPFTRFSAAVPCHTAKFEIKENIYMHCYRHPTQQAIAICRHCGKATCSNCCQESLHGIACSSACAAELQQYDLLMIRLKQTYGIGFRPPLPASVPSYFFFGLILLLTGIYLYFSEARVDYLILAMSAVFFVMAAGSYKRYRDVCVDC